MAVGPSAPPMMAMAAQGVGAEERHEDTDLRGGAEQEALRVGDQRAEIGHRPHADEDQAGIDTQFHTQVEVVEQSGIRHENIPVDMSVGEKLGMVEVRTGQVGEQHAEGDGEQQQRFELVPDSQVEQEECHTDHGDAPPSHLGEETRDARRTGEITQAVPYEVSVRG